MAGWHSRRLRIGETQPNGSQHGVGVSYTTQNGTTSCNACVTSGHATGTLSGNSITNYQKNGVVISGTGAAVTAQSNTVTGYGMINHIAQNGIEVASGATASIMGNTVSGNVHPQGVRSRFSNRKGRRKAALSRLAGPAATVLPSTRTDGAWAASLEIPQLLSAGVCGGYWVRARSARFPARRRRTSVTAPAIARRTAPRAASVHSPKEVAVET
jgi:hypothetical protein